MTVKTLMLSFPHIEDDITTVSEGGGRLHYVEKRFSITNIYKKTVL